MMNIEVGCLDLSSLGKNGFFGIRIWNDRVSELEILNDLTFDEIKSLADQLNQIALDIDIQEKER